jgi:hypothetical protein
MPRVRRHRSPELIRLARGEQRVRHRLESLTLQTHSRAVLFERAEVHMRRDVALSRFFDHL